GAQQEVLRSRRGWHGASRRLREDRGDPSALQVEAVAVEGNCAACGAGSAGRGAAVVVTRWHWLPLGGRARRQDYGSDDEIHARRRRQLRRAQAADDSAAGWFHRLCRPFGWCGYGFPE